MSKCAGCNKPVYFAERLFSVGKDWHRACLRCGECNKVLVPGQHAERRGQPYCTVPCYGALFGPVMFGHGSPIEAHNQFGNKPKPQQQIRRPDLQVRLKAYNTGCESNSLQIKSKEVNGRLVLEGPLRVHWGVQQPIQFKEKEEQQLLSSPTGEPATLASTIGKDWQRRSYCMAINNGLSDDFMSLLDNGGSTLKGRQNSLEDILTQLRLDEIEEAEAAVAQTSTGGGRERGAGTELRRYNTVSYKGDHGGGGNIRRHRINNKRSSRRLSMINGHVFHSDTSIFLPSRDSVSTVTISGLDRTPEVIKLLLDKFKVENDPDDYCLCVVKKSGEMKMLKSQDYPLVERVMHGPVEEDAKIFIKEKCKVQTISEEVAPFVNLPNAMLEGFLNKYKEEEEQEKANVRLKYARLKVIMEKRLAEISTQM